MSMCDTAEANCLAAHDVYTLRPSLNPRIILCMSRISKEALRILRDHGEDAYVIGEIVPGKPGEPRIEIVGER